jgi:Spy/CpxP family protein refolding chaperone
MNKLLIRATVAVALLSCVAMVAAQARPGRQGGRGGANNEVALLMRKDVQSDLALSEEQKKKVAELQTATRGQRGQRPRNRGGDAGAAGAAGSAQGMDREEMRKRMQEQRAKTQESLKAILSESQMKRLDEISIQLRGNRAVMDAQVQKSIGITDEQKAKIEGLQQKQQEANRSLGEKARNNEITREDVQKARQKNDEAMGAELAKILTPEQAAKLKSMAGKPFKADPPQGGGRR